MLTSFNWHGWMGTEEGRGEEALGTVFILPLLNDSGAYHKALHAALLTVFDGPILRETLQLRRLCREQGEEGPVRTGDRLCG